VWIIPLNVPRTIFLLEQLDYLANLPLPRYWVKLSCNGLSAGCYLHLGILEDVLVPLRARACYGEQQQLGPSKHEPDGSGNRIPAFSSSDREFDLLLLRQLRLEIVCFHIGSLVERVSGMKKVPYWARNSDRWDGSRKAKAHFARS